MEHFGKHNYGSRTVNSSREVGGGNSKGIGALKDANMGLLEASLKAAAAIGRSLQDPPVRHLLQASGNQQSNNQLLRATCCRASLALRPVPFVHALEFQSTLIRLDFHHNPHYKHRAETVLGPCLDGSMTSSLMTKARRRS